MKNKGYAGLMILSLLVLFMANAVVVVAKPEDSGPDTTSDEDMWVLEKIDEYIPKRAGSPGGDSHEYRYDYDNSLMEYEWNQDGKIFIEDSVKTGTETGIVQVSYQGLKEKIEPGENIRITGKFYSELNGLRLIGSDGELYKIPYIEFSCRLKDIKTNETNWESEKFEHKMPFKQSGDAYSATEYYDLKFPEKAVNGDRVAVLMMLPGEGNMGYIEPYDKDNLPEGFVYTNFSDEHARGMSINYIYVYQGEESSIPGKTSQIINKDTNKDDGEETINMKTAVVIGLAATVASIIAAGGALAGGAAGGISGGVFGEQSNLEKIKEEAKRKTGDYRMIIYKSFGDTIKSDDDNQYIIARMESKNEHTGTWSYDAGLSENISVIIPDIPGLVANRRQPDPGRPGKGYSIVLEDKSPMYDSVTITFEFRAPDGSLFQRNMKFNILGDMRIWLKSDKVWFVNEDYDTFDLECKLIYFDPDKYEVILGGLADTDNFIKLELEKQDLDSEDEENVFIKITPIEGIYEKWDGERLIYEYSCFIAYRDKETLEEIAATPFIVHFCYECIGVAIGDPDEIEGIDVRIDKLPEPFELWAFKDYEAHKRTEEKLNLAFFVSRWNKKEEKIEFDKEAAKSLKLTFDIESLSEHFDGANKDEAIKALKESEIIYRCFDRKEEAKTNINKNIMYREGMNPAYYVVVTKNETKGNMESFPIVLNVSLPGHKYTKYKDLELKGTFYPARDWAEIVKWFFAFSKGISVEDLIWAGKPEIYLKALEFIENRVYSFNNVPFMTKSQENHYEDGILESHTTYRKRSVVLREGSIPKGIGDYKKAQSLVHELTHAIEHMNSGSTGTFISKEADHERHAYFLQYASDAVYELTLAEKATDINIRDGHVKEAIARLYLAYNNPNNTPELRNTHWFGSNIPTMNALFTEYVDRWKNFGAGAPGAGIGESVSRLYYPGILRNSNSRFPACFTVTSGAFKGTSFLMAWNQGYLRKFQVVSDKYDFNILKPLRWLGDYNLRVQLEVVDKGTGGKAGPRPGLRGRDIFKVLIVSKQKLDINNADFVEIKELTAIWVLERETEAGSIASPDVVDGKMVTPLVKNDGAKLAFQAGG